AVNRNQSVPMVRSDGRWLVVPVSNSSASPRLLSRFGHSPVTTPLTSVAQTFLRGWVNRLADEFRCHHSLEMTAIQTSREARPVPHQDPSWSWHSFAATGAVKAIRPIFGGRDCLLSRAVCPRVRRPSNQFLPASLRSLRGYGQRAGSRPPTGL